MLEILETIKRLHRDSNRRSSLDATQLESRVLLSASPVAENNVDIVEAEQSTAVEQVILESNDTGDTPEGFRFSDQSEAPQSVAAETARVELVFVDTGADDYEQLVADLMNEADSSRDFEVFLLEADRDGIEQISEVMAAYEGVDAVHLVSHGVAGSVKLGSTWLSIDTLGAYAGDIAGWNHALNDGGDLLIYGCNLADSEDGRTLAESLGALCNCDVAASDDDTGNANRGGDFDLEFTTGIIETDIAFSSRLQEDWQGLLAYKTYRDNFDAVAYNNSDGTEDWTGDFWQEPGDDANPNTGDVSFDNYLGEDGFDVGNAGQSAIRSVDLSTASTAFLSFRYARRGLDDANDYIALQISSDGGGTWTELDRFTGTANDLEMQSAGYDISAYASANTQIRFAVSDSLNSSESLFIDDLQIAFSTSTIDDTSQQLVNTNQTGDQQTSSNGRGSTNAVAVAANGDYVVVWTDTNGSDSDVYAQRYDAAGAKQGAAFMVNTTASLDQEWASVAIDADGNFAVTWTSLNQDGAGQGVYVRLFDANGVAQTGEIRVNSTTNGEQHASSIAMSASGEFVVVWQGQGAGDTTGVFAQRYNAAGVAQGGETLVNVSTSGTQDSPAVDMNSSGQYVVVWDDGGGVHARQFNADGSVASGQINVDSGVSAGDGDVAIDENGGFVSIWRETISSSRNVLGQRYNSHGAKVGGQFTVNTTTANNQTNPSVASDAAGNFVVVWEGDGAGDTNGVFAQSFDSQGNAIGGETLVNTASGNNESMASVDMLRPGEFIVTWTGSDSDDDGVYVRQFTNVRPTAGVSGAYTIAEGDSLSLDASTSNDPDGTIASYEWDLDNDGVYGEAGEPTGANPAVSWATLQSLGINDDGTYTIRLRVTDNQGAVDTTTTTVIVTNTAPDLTVSGDANVFTGVSYTLELSAFDPGDDAITSWTIDWGDGSFSTVAGNATSATHEYQVGGLTHNIVVGATDEDGVWHESELIVTGVVSHSVFRYDADGNELQEFAVGDLTSPAVSVVGPDGLLYVSGYASSDVNRYNAATGAFIDTFVTSGSGGLNQATDLAFGIDGNLYIADHVGDRVLRYDGATGAFIDVFVAADPAKLNGPTSLFFGPGGKLNVAGFFSNNIAQYDGVTGAYLGEFVASGSGGLSGPQTATYGPDGNLYVASYTTDQILRYDRNTGAFIDVFVSAGLGGLDGPVGVAFGPDGQLYVGSESTDQVLRYNGSTGAFIDVFASGGNLDGARDVAFLPSQQVTVSDPTVTLTAAADTYLDKGNADDNFGTSTSLVVDKSGGSIGDSRAVLQFDLDSLPVGSVITGAVLQLEATANTGAFDINVYEVTQAWQEGASSGAIGAASWNERLPGTNWNTAGGDFDSAIIATLNTAAIGQHTWDITSLVQDWYTGAKTNNGLILGSPDSGGETVTYDSREGGTPPQLILQYTVVNDPPTDIAINNTSIDENIDTTGGDLIGTLSASDPEVGETFSYSIRPGGDAANFSLVGDQLFLDDGVLNFENKPSYSVTIRVTDSASNTYDETFTITVNDLNEAPSISSANAFNVDENNTAVATLTASDVDAGDSVNWSITGGDDSGAFSIDMMTGELTFNTAPDFEAPTDTGANNTYQVEVTASDSGGATAVQLITVTVNAANDNNPVFSTTATANVNEGSTIVKTVNATDADAPSQTVTYSITGGVDAARFNINGASGELTFATAPDFETPTDANTDNVYVVEITANDGAGGITTQTISVTVNAINDNLPVFASSNTPAVVEGNTAVVTLNATDADAPAQMVTYTITGGVDAGRFAMNGGNQLAFIAAPDFESPADANSDNIYEVSVTADDGNGGTTVQMLLVSVINANEAPNITSANVFNVVENNANVATVTSTDVDGGAPMYSISGGADAARFTINASSGLLQFITSPDFESPSDAGANNVYEVEVTVNDGNGGVDSQLMNVMVLAANDNSPTFTSPTTFAMNEGETSAGTVVATDADSPASTVTYSVVGGADGSKFVIDANTGELGFLAAPEFHSPTDANADNVYEVIVAASDGSHVTNQSITVTVANTNNAPTITSPPDYNTSENSTHVTTISASDVDGDSITFAIVGGADASQFVIDHNTGVLRFIATPNYENTTAASGNNTYEVIVRASDGNGGFDQRAITVSVTNVNDAPQISLPRYVVGNNRTLAVAAPGYLAGVGDEDGDALVVSLVKATENGMLTFNADGSFEYTANENFSGEDSFTIRVRDGAGGESTATIRLQVNAAAAAIIQAPEATTTVEEETTPEEETSTEEETSSDEEITAAAVANAIAPQNESTGDSQQIGAVLNVPATVISETQIALNFATADEGEASSYLPLETIVQTKRNATNRVAGSTAHVGSTYTAPFDTALLWEDLGEMEQELQTGADTPYFVAGSAAAFTSSLTVGYVLWTIRSGWLVTSMLAQLPAWRIVDPLVVLDYLDDPAAGSDEESLESMLEKNKSEEETHIDTSDAVKTSK